MAHNFLMRFAASHCGPYIEMLALVVRNEFMELFCASRNAHFRSSQTRSALDHMEHLAHNTLVFGDPRRMLIRAYREIRKVNQTNNMLELQDFSSVELLFGHS